jgi:hypothetical protein
MVGARASGHAPHVAFVTHRGLPNGSEDDALAVRELAARGLRVTSEVWDDPSVAWDEFDLVVVRSTWDYHRRPAEFLAWAERVARVTRLENPLEILRWNAHKGYLLDLAARGVDVVPTELVRSGSRAPLEELRARWPGADLVVKPAYGGNAEGLLQVCAAGPDEAAERAVERLAEAGDVLVQPFVSDAPRDGERSFVFFDGKLSHAVAYRFVLNERERAPRAFEPTELERTGPERALAGIHPTPLYARLDVLPAGGGRWWLGEMELIEPELLFRGAPEGAARFASAIAARLSGPAAPPSGAGGSPGGSRGARPSRSPRGVSR